MSCGRVTRAVVTLATVCGVLFLNQHIDGNEPSPGERREITFVGEGGEECVIAFRWCPSAVMKDGHPDSPNGKPNSPVEGFWITETEVSQQAYQIIAGEQSMNNAKSYVLDNIAKPVPPKPPEELTDNDRRAIEERTLAEKKYFGDGSLPIWGIPPADADDFSVKMSQSYDRFKAASGRKASFSTVLFRLPAHYEWQHACRGGSGKKHFVTWPDNPKTKQLGESDNFVEFLRKKNPDLYKKHQAALDSFDGTEDSMVNLLSDSQLEKEVRRYLEELLRELLAPESDLRRVADASSNSWNIKGMVGNVAEWVWLVENPSADRGNMPSPGDFSIGTGNAKAACAGSWNSPSGKNVPWPHLSIWHWQKETTYSHKQQDKARGQFIGMRIVMTDAVAETWFVDLRQMAEQAYEGKVTAKVLLDGFESGVEVSGRDKEGRAIAGARIGIFGALAKARSGDSKGAGKLLRDSVASLGEGGDEFFQQVSAVIQDDDLGELESAAQQ